MPLSIRLEFEATIVSLIPPAPIPSNKHAQLSIVSDAIRASHLNACPYISTSVLASPTPNCTLWNILTIPDVYSQSNSAYKSHFNVEIVSPILFDTGKDYWKQEVRTALSAVAQRVVWKSSRSAGLHVHVGPSREDKFTLPQMKKLAMFICRFESALDTLSPIKDNKDLLSNRYNELLKNLTIDEVYDTIQKVTDVTGLVQVMNFVHGDGSKVKLHHGDFDFKVNFTTLLKHDSVEFRQHEGTVSGDIAVHWADFVLRFVQFAIDTTDNIIKAGGDTLMDLGTYVRLP